VLTVAVVVLVLSFASIGAFSPPGPTPTSTNWQLGSGFVTMSALQQVGIGAQWETYCSKGYCMDPVGVAYVPSAKLLLLTELGGADFGGGQNAFLAFDPATLLGTQAVPLNCTPWVPFYPGVSANVLVPCYNATLNLLAIDVPTDRVVSSVGVPSGIAGGSSSMAYDPINGMVYWGANPNAVDVYDPVNETFVATTHPPAPASRPGASATTTSWSGTPPRTCC
jgi:hypothetical protein